MKPELEKPDILFVDDEEHLRFAACQTFELAGLTVQCFDQAKEALRHVSRNFSGIIISDIRMPELDGLSFLKQVLEIDFELPVLLVTGHGDIQMAVDAMRQGAYDFIEKPYAPDHLTEVVRRAIDKRRLILENRELRSSLTKRDELEVRLTGRTDIMVNLRKTIRAIAPTESDVLIFGETGTGKGVAAQAIHALSPRSKGPFVAIQCGLLSSDQMERELFGHEAGAFPGALRPRYGKFEHGRGGTIFLDEIENMSIEMQARLIQVFEKRTITRLGSNNPIELDVRFIVASKKDLQKEVEEGRFRDDLYYRLGAVSMKMPTLAERSEDIPRLFVQLANEAARRYRRDFPEISPTFLSELQTQDWKGNVRELRNVADQYTLGLLQDAEENKTGEGGTLFERLARFEKSVIQNELQAKRGVLKETYQALGLSRKSLYEKMQKYGLEKSQFIDE